MSVNILRILSLTSLKLIVYGSFSTAQINVEAQLRPRSELRDGYQKLAEIGLTPAIFVSQRTRLGLGYESDFLKLKFTPQDIRVWGDEQVSSATGVFGDQASLELFEAYVGIRIGNSAWINIGRQQLVYDNEWLLAARNWNQQGIAYDAIVLKLCPREWQMDIGISWNAMAKARSGNFYPPDRIKSLNYLWLNRELSELLKMSFLHVAAGYTESSESEKINFSHTSGIYTLFDHENFSLNADFYYQYGKNRQGTDVSALLLASGASYKLGKLTPGLGISYLSGNRTTVETISKDNLFSILYGARHKYFGFMDYFRDPAADTGGGGLVNCYFNAKYSFSGSLSLRNIIHYFMLAQTNPNTPDSKGLGWENDLVASYKFQDWGTLEFGYCFFIPHEALKTVQNINGDKYSQFIYLQLTVIYELLK